MSAYENSGSAEATRAFIIAGRTGGLRVGSCERALPQPLPWTLGSDISAIVDRVGEGAILLTRGDALEARRRTIRALFMLVEVTSERLRRVPDLIDAEAARARVGSVLPLAACRAAHEMLEGAPAHGPGKIVLEVKADPPRRKEP